MESKGGGGNSCLSLQPSDLEIFKSHIINIGTQIIYMQFGDWLYPIYWFAFLQGFGVPEMFKNTPVFGVKMEHLSRAQVQEGTRI